MKKRVLKSTCAALAAVVMVSGFWYASRETEDTTVPQLVSYVDPFSGDGTVTIEEEEIPLSSKPVVSTKVSTKTSTKKTKLKKKSAKTSKKTTRKTKKSSNVKVTSTQKVATDTTVLTTATTSLKKNSNVKTVKTTVKTTVTTTTTNIASSAGTSTSTAATSSSASKTTVAIRSIAPKAHSNVLSAYEKLNFTVTVDPSVDYSGKFDAKTQSIIVRKNSDEAIYHELGHFVAFVAGNVDTTAEFQKIYASEKSKFVGTRGNDSYVTSTAEEYFAESYQDYVENPTALKSARPQTYTYVANAVAKITDAKVAQLKQLYASVWK